MNLLALLTTLIYSAVVVDQLLRLLGIVRVSSTRFFALSGLALIGHTLLLYQWIETASGQDLNLMNIASLTTWLMGLLILTPGLKKPLANLALFIFPLSALSLIGASLTHSEHIIRTQLQPGVLVHIILSLAATSLLGLSAIQATVIWGQHSLLKRHRLNQLLRFLPAIETMERFLFKLIWSGFAFLSCSLLTGLMYIEAFFSFSLLSKTGLAFCAWGLFLMLLIGRHRYGWRGKKAVKLTVGGTLSLIIAYFGTQLWFN